MAKKKKVNLLSIILLAVAAVGLVLAIVGIAVSWFTLDVKTVLGNDSTSASLFKEKLGEGVDFPIACVQAFAIITLILAAIACVALALNSLGVVKVKWLLRAVCAGVVILCAVLTFIFALVFANQLGGVDAGNFASASVKAGAGAYLLPIGALLTSVPLFFGKN